MTDLHASALASFSPLTRSGGSLSLTQISVSVGPDGVGAKLVDSVPAGTLMLFATYGTVEIVGSYTENIRERLEAMQGTQFVDTPYGESLDFVLCFNEQGVPFTPVVTSLNGGKRKKLNQKAWGLVKHGAYTRPWQLLKYKPSLVEASGGILQVTYGTVAAYKEGYIATLDMQPLPLLDTDDIEVYRITSRSVVTEDGEFEYPPNWPTDGEYPGYSGDDKPEAGTGVVPLRVHEICTMNDNGYISVRKYPVRNAKPYTGSGSYTPTKAITEGDNSKIPVAYQSKAHQIYVDRAALPL